MTEKKNQFTRRQALGAMGKVAAGTVIGTAVLNTDILAETDARSTTLNFTAARYVAYLHSAPQYSWESRIFLYSNPFKFSCVLMFMKEGQTIPANTVSPDGVSATVYFPRNRYEEIRDFLRYEKPVTVTVVGTNGIATISNGEYELVGDHDM